MRNIVCQKSSNTSIARFCLRMIGLERFLHKEDLHLYLYILLKIELQSICPQQIAKWLGVVCVCVCVCLCVCLSVRRKSQEATDVRSCTKEIFGGFLVMQSSCGNRWRAIARRTSRRTKWVAAGCLFVWCLKQSVGLCDMSLFDLFHIHAAASDDGRHVWRAWC